MAKKKWKTQDYLAVGGLLLLVMHLTSKGRQQPNGGSQIPLPPPNTGGGTSFDINYWVEKFEKTFASCYFTCDHRCDNFELIYNALTDADLITLDAAIISKHGFSMRQKMDTYWDYGCAWAENYGTYLYNKLKNLGL